MSVKKSIILREIICNFATPTQVLEYDELASVNKGSATHMALRLIQKYFEKKNQRENYTQPREKIQESTRLFKINGYGKSWYSKS